MYAVIGGTSVYATPYIYGIYHSFDKAVNGALELYADSAEFEPTEEEIEIVKEALEEFKGYDDLCEIAACEIKD